MRNSLWKSLFAVVLMEVLVGLTIPVLAQDKPADSMDILRDKIKADKKLLVSMNMELTEAEAKGFWPVYENYQADLQKIDLRITSLIASYAEDYKNRTLTDEKAKKLIDESVAVEQAQVALTTAYIPRLSKVLPMKKVARYLQIENKIRAIAKYEFAEGVPLVQ